MSSNRAQILVQLGSTDRLSPAGLLHATCTVRCRVIRGERNARPNFLRFELGVVAQGFLIRHAFRRVHKPGDFTVVRLRLEGEGYTKDWLAPEGVERSKPARDGDGDE